MIESWWCESVYHVRSQRSLQSNFGSPVVVKRYMQTNWFQLFFKFWCSFVSWRCLGKKYAIMSKASPYSFPKPHANGGSRTHLPHLEKSTTNLTKSVGKSTDFGKIRHRLWENQPSTLGKWATDYGKRSHRLRENEPPTLRKSATDFGKMSHRRRENEPPTLGKWAADFGKMSHRLREKEPPTSGKWAPATHGNSKQVSKNSIKQNNLKINLYILLR